MAVPVVCSSLGGGEEPCAHPYGLSSEHQCRCQAPAVGDAACGDDRKRRDGIDHGRHQRQRRCETPHMSTGLPALCHHGIGSGVGGVTRLVRRADSVHVDGACGVNGRGTCGRVAPEGGDDWYSTLPAGVQSFSNGEVEHQVGAEGVLCQLADPVDDRGDLLHGRPGESQHAKAARIGYGSDQLRGGRGTDRCLDEG